MDVIIIIFFYELQTHPQPSTGDFKLVESVGDQTG